MWWNLNFQFFFELIHQLLFFSLFQKACLRRAKDTFLQRALRHVQFFARRVVFVTQRDAGYARVVSVDRDIQPGGMHLHQRMCFQRVHHAGLIIAGDAHFEGGAAFARQINNRINFQHAHAMSDSIRADLLDGFAHIVAGSPLAGVDGHVQAGLLGLFEDSVKRLGRKIRFVAGQVHRNDSVFDVIGRQP